MQIKRLLELLKISKFDKIFLFYEFLALIIYLAYTTPITSILLFWPLGFWLVSKPSDWLAEGVNGFAYHFTLSEYLVGLLTSLTAISAELAITIFSIYISFITGSTEIITIAVLSLTFSMNFNLLLLGIITRKTGKKILMVPEEVLAREIEVISWTVFTIFLLVFLNLLNFFTIGVESKLPILLPQFGGVILIITYFTYFFYMSKYIKTTHFERIKSDLTLNESIIITLIGAFSVTLGGEFISDGILGILDNFRSIISTIGDPVIIVSIIVGIAGAAYDIAMNYILTSRGQIIASLGNLVGSNIQIITLIFGIIALLVPVTTNLNVLYLLFLDGLSLWFIRQLVFDDRTLDAYEGEMLATLVAFGLILSLFL